MSVNIFRGFADKARSTEAHHAHVRMTAERERVERRIEVDVRSALAQLAAARAREEAGRAALTQARESQRIIRDRYEGGLATLAGPYAYLLAHTSDAIYTKNRVASTGSPCAPTGSRVSS